MLLFVSWRETLNYYSICFLELYRPDKEWVKIWSCWYEIRENAAILIFELVQKLERKFEIKSCSEYHLNVNHTASQPRCVCVCPLTFSTLHYIFTFACFPDFFFFRLWIETEEVNRFVLSAELDSSLKIWIEWVSYQILRHLVWIQILRDEFNSSAPNLLSLCNWFSKWT